MQITETNTNGLKREFKVVVTSQEIQKNVEQRLQELGRSVKMAGFRPGKVPMAVLKQRYGQSVMGEVLERTVATTSQRAMSERSLRPALQPKIEVTSFDEGKDLEYTMAVELMPDVEPGDFGGLKLERPVAAVEDKAVDEAMERLAKAQRTTEVVTKKRAAKLGDVAVVDFDGSVDGERQPGMKGDDFPLELGSKQFIDTFEEQLVGAKVGDHKQVKVTFPKDYGKADLAGREAIFEVDVKELREYADAKLDDEFAKKFGLESLEQLRGKVRERIEQEYAQAARLRLKRQLLDTLADQYDFAVPQGMVDLEFDAIWKRLQDEIKAGAAPEEAKKSEDDLKTEYRSIAERRVRLGLLLAEVGRRHNIQVGQDELNRAVFAEAQRYPGQERQVLEFFRSNPRALESLRAPLFEDKVVDFIVELAKVSEKSVSAEELLRDPDAQAA